MILRPQHYALVSLAVVVALAALAFALLGSRPSGMRVLCGSSMSLPIAEVQTLFEAAEGPMTIDVGGSETLLPRVLVADGADVFVCHDPFEEKVREAGLLSDSVVVGVLRPVVLVAKGNPRNIRSVEDLAGEGLKLGCGDPRYSTCGELFVELLDRKGIASQVQRNVVFEGRTHSELANGLITGHLDAVIVWNFIAPLHAAAAEVAPTDDAYPPVRVTVLGLKASANPKQRDALLELCRQPQVQNIFQRHGYTAE
jgi:molybdate transport system substrate-binding protein